MNEILELKRYSTILRRLAMVYKDRVPTVEEFQAALREVVSESRVDADNWGSLFPTYQEFVDVQEPKSVIDRIMREGEVTMIGASPKHGKTWFLLSMVKALLSGRKFLDHFDVQKSKRVVYLIPEAGLRQAKRRLWLMRLMEYMNPVNGPSRLFVMPRRIGMVTDLADARILKASEGADVFLDTLVRFVEGDENSVADMKKFSELVLNLATIARTVTIAHHSTKDFTSTNSMTSQSMLRGSGDIIAMMSNAYGLLQTDKATNRICVKTLDARDDEQHLETFEIEGRPHINNEGDFKMVRPPGEGSEPKKKTRPKSGAWEHAAEIKKLKAEGVSQNKLAEQFDVSPHTIKEIVDSLF